MSRQTSPRELPRRSRLSRHRARKPLALAIERLEDRTMLDSSPPSIVVGRTLSSYFVGGVQNNQETITYTVYNEQADPETGMLLTTTLEPGVTFSSASQQPDQSGRNLAWSLGTIQGYDSASVTLTVALATPIPTQLDSGAQAFATLDAAVVSAATPAALLQPGNVSDPSLLASTPDANTTDPYVQEMAAQLDYNAQDIFSFLHTQIGYNSYTGSMRGARGTLWSSAGNALDVASLGVALMRASGIPAQYVSGMLSQSDAQTLILSMFPAPSQTVGYIPSGTQVSDPADDPQLLSETESHYWFQFNTGTGMQDADPLLPGAAIGQTFTTSTGTFAEVPDDLRDQTEVALTAEIYDQGAATLGIGDGLSDTVVLDQTFNDVALEGRPLTIGNLVSSSSTAAVAFTTTTNTYTPYIDMSDDAYPYGSHDELVTGTPYQEVLTTLPLGSQVLTGLFLNVSLTGPGLATETYQRTLFDRIGYAARQGLVPTSVSVDPTAAPAISPFDLESLNVLPGLTDPNAGVQSLHAVQQDASQLMAIQNAGTEASQAAPVLVGFNTAQTSLIAAEFATLSNLHTSQLAELSSVKAYFDRPSLVIVSSHLTTDPTTQMTSLSFSIDLRRDTMRVIAAPGQDPDATIAFNVVRGVYESVVEGNVLQAITPPTNGQPAQVYSTATVFAVAQAQDVPLIVVTPDTLSLLDGLAIDADAKAEITTAVNQGNLVIVPAQDVPVNGTETTAWYQIDTTTGETIGVTDDGGHQGIVEYGAALGFVALLVAIVTPYVMNAINYGAGMTRAGLEAKYNGLPAGELLTQLKKDKKAAASWISKGTRPSPPSRQATRRRSWVCSRFLPGRPRVSTPSCFRFCRTRNRSWSRPIRWCQASRSPGP